MRHKKEVDEAIKEEVKKAVKVGIREAIEIKEASGEAPTLDEKEKAAILLKKRQKHYVTKRSK